MPLTAVSVGIGVAPQVSNAQALSGTRVRVRFSEPMTVNALLLNPASYTITEDVGSNARTVIDVGSDGTDAVQLQLDGVMTAGVLNYNVLVDNGVVDAAGNALNPAFDNVDFHGNDTSAAIESHCDLALARLASQFRGKPRIESLICTFASRWDGPEQDLADIRGYRSLERAFGVQLDRLGDWLGLLRNGLDDQGYRLRLRAQALTNASHGRPNELLDLLFLLDDGFLPATINLLEVPVATSVLHVRVPEGEDPLGTEFVTFLRRAKATGTRLILLYEEEGPPLFTWILSDGSITPPADSGWGDGLWGRAVD